MFGRCPPRVRVTVVRLDIVTVVKSVHTLHLPRLAVLLVTLFKTSRDVDACVNIINTHVDSVGQSAMTETNCFITLRRCIVGGSLLVVSASVPFVSISGLNKMHKQLTRYRCETCGKGCIDRSRYYDHAAAHTGVKQYTCSICEKKFMNNGLLRKHVLHFHPNEAAHIV